MTGVSRYEDFHAWQLSVELRDDIFKLTEASPVLKNLEFRDQIRKSSSSAPANIAEGFGRFKPREFAHFVRIARGSLKETRNHLQDGLLNLLNALKGMIAVSWRPRCHQNAIGLILAPSPI